MSRYYELLNKLPQAMRSADLPIFEIEQLLLETLTTKKRLVLTAPTGSGKSTQVPQMLLDAGLLRHGQVISPAAAPLAHANARGLGRAGSKRQTWRRGGLSDAAGQR